MRINEKNFADLDSAEHILGYLQKANLYTMLNLGRLTHEEVFMGIYQHILHINSNLWNLVLFSILIEKKEQNAEELYANTKKMLQDLITDFILNVEKIQNNKTH